MAKSRRDSADSYTLRARKEGYPARSVYKLEEMQVQHRLIRPGDKVLDVGAAPGSWTLYVHNKILKDTGSIVAVDLNPLSLNPVPFNVTSLTGDAFSSEIREQLTSLGPYDVIISDAAPMTTGIRSVDTSKSEYLSESVFHLALEQLKVHGNLVIKIYQGGGEATLLQEMRKRFKKAKGFKPKASRSDSFELFLIGLDKLGDNHINQ
ncbi:MAG: RlmE family RNA methyltransferase [Spirochaetia bacterium]|nr:RlmE family RNA methyltransferase [Spirochaetia bacterium]